jgi:hypothetical protein
MNFAFVKNLDSHIEGEYRPIVFENRVVRNIFGPKRDEVTKEPERLRNEEFRH